MSKMASTHDVLMRSKRRCCFCFGLSQDLRIKPGQIAHIDQNPNNNSFENLAWMCLNHHDEYDSKTRQSRGLTEREARDYCDALYRHYEERNAKDDEFCGQLPYEPATEMDYEGREHQKRLAYGLMRSSRNEDRKTGLLMLIEAHFHRQPKNLVGDFRTYVAHWLHADKDSDPSLVAELIAEYGIPQHPRIKPGYSDWGSYGDTAYQG